MITTNTLVLIIVIILMLVGIAGIIFPVLPGSGTYIRRHCRLWVV